jgi:glycosyltransferase involved in cell wall biosynthesis
VGVVANLQERKGHKFLLDALAQIEPKVGPVHALFAGEGPEEGGLREQGLRLGMAERVHFLGFRDDVNAIVSACDIVALPSRKEGLSIAVMEAMALRRPVIATRIAGMPELVKNGETGLLVAPFETEPLAAALEALLTDSGLRERLAERGRHFLEERFDQRECLARVEAFLTTIVQSWQNGELVNGADWHPDR